MDGDAYLQPGRIRTLQVVAVVMVQMTCLYEATMNDMS